MQVPSTRLRELIQAARLHEAESLAVTLCETGAASGEVWFLLGAARHQLGRLIEALEAFEQALRIDPSQREAPVACAVVLCELGRNEAALEIFDRLLLAAPGDPGLLTNSAIVFEKLGRTTDALARYDAALRADPGLAQALLNRSAALAASGRYDQALADAQRLSVLHPGLADAHYNRAEILLAMFQSPQALAACDAAIALDPQHGRAHFNRGLALSELRRFREARQAFERAAGIDPSFAATFERSFLDAGGAQRTVLNPRLIFLMRSYERQLCCDWGEREHYLQEMTELARNADPEFPFVPPLAYQVLTLIDEPSMHHAIAARVAAQVSAPVKPFVAGRRHRARRIRVGYLSPDYREHLNAYLTLPLFQKHSRERFEVYAYSLHPEDGSAARHRISVAADQFVDLSTRGDADALQAMRNDDIDILVDLGGYTSHSRPALPAARAAPIQVNYLGFPGTMGAEFVDYRLTDSIVTPAGSESCWSERLVFLPGTFFIYDDQTARPQPVAKRADYGLPEAAFVFCCFNNTYKIGPEVFESWMRILRRTPQSVLWLRGWNTRVNENLKNEALARGVAASRLVFAPFEARERYFARYQLADLFLDTFTFNAMTTACDALWMGLPVLTRPGRSTAARVGASLLAALDMQQMVASDTLAYELIACELAADPSRLALLVRELAAKRSTAPLFQTEAKVRAIEHAYLSMWKRHSSGESPGSFTVSADSLPQRWF